MSQSIRQFIVAALKQNLIPGLILQAFALVILLVYFLVPQTKPMFEWFGGQKQTYGFAYSFVATAFFGGLIPFLYLWRAERIEKSKHLGMLALFYLVFWGLKGMEVDYFYRLQAGWFGNGNALSTIICKVAVDQFLYSALWAAPSITLAYLWMESGYSFGAFWRALNKQFLCGTMPSVILSNWLVWIPAVSIVYAMPSELQIPLFNLVLCFWVLLLAVLNKKSA